MKKILSKLDIIMLSALGLIAGGVHQLLGSGYAMLSIGALLLVLGLLVARGGAE